MITPYEELIANAWYVGFTHGEENHTLSEMMLSCERAVGRTIPLDVWLDLFDGWESGRKAKNAPEKFVPIDYTDVPF